MSRQGTKTGGEPPSGGATDVKGPARAQTVTGAAPAAHAPAIAVAQRSGSKTQILGSHSDDGGPFGNVPTWELSGQSGALAFHQAEKTEVGATRTVMAGGGVPLEVPPVTSGATPASSPSIEILTSQLDLTGYRAELELATAVDSPRAAAYRVARHQLLAQHPGAAIMVTSAERGEGKSVTALNLALAFAELSPGKTLLVEANFRRPWLAKTLRLKRYRCFREQMVAQQAQPSMPLGVVHLAPTALHIMPVRPWNPGEPPTPFLDAIALARAMYTFRAAGYERIVVDASAVLEAADVNLLQDTCDGIVTVVKARQTSAAHLREVIERLSPARFLGTLMV